MSTEMGKLIGQFRSFTISSAQRITVAGLQQRDLNALSGFVSMVGLGIFTEYLYAKMNGKDLSDNPAAIIKAGIDRSGVLGWLMDINNISEKITGGSVGLSRLAGGQTSSRYTNINSVGALIGPSFGLIQDLGQLAYAGGNGEWTQKDSRTIRRLAPMQNVFYLRKLFDQVEAGVNSELGIQK
jgi:hypothetical protein